jgi:hypothetical protein
MFELNVFVYQFYGNYSILRMFTTVCINISEKSASSETTVFIYEASWHLILDENNLLILLKLRTKIIMSVV